MTGQTGTGIVNPWNTLLGASGTESVCSSRQVKEIPSSQSHSACAAEVVDVAVSFSVTLDVGCHFSHQGQRPCLPQEADCTPPSAALLSCSLLSGRVSCWAPRTASGSYPGPVCHQPRSCCLYGVELRCLAVLPALLHACCWLRAVQGPIAALINTVPAEQL